jgi:hypothetical protein
MTFQAVGVGDEYYKMLEDVLATQKTQHQWQETVVNAPFRNRGVTGLLGLGIVVFLLVNRKTKTIDRITLTDNEMKAGAFSMTAVPFHQIKVPLGYTQNFISKAIREQNYMITSDWQYILNPVLSPEQARFNQAGSGIACSVIYPLPRILDGAAMIFSYYEPIDRIGKAHHNFMTRYISIAQRTFPLVAGKN